MRRREPVDYDRPTYNYKAFDSYGLLLYVGCSLNVKNRLAAHRTGSQWWRFAETVGVLGPWDRAEALRRERHSIENEGPYFNSSFADMARTNANRVAAQARVQARGHILAKFDDDRGEDADYAAVREAEWRCWYRAVEREQMVLKAGAYPFTTDEDRLARYLAARGDAEAARLKAAS